MDGKLYHFGVKGIYKGQGLLGDDETTSYWHHITGECLHGPMVGATMEHFPIEHTNILRAVKTNPEIEVASYSIPWTMRLFQRIVMRKDRGGYLYAPLIRAAKLEGDARLPGMTNGLGLFTQRSARFYPLESLQRPVFDNFDGRPVMVYIDQDDACPHALWLQDGQPNEDDRRPMQVFTRWYGFVHTFPDSEIFDPNELLHGKDAKEVE